MESQHLPIKFPNLFAETIWSGGPIRVQFVLLDQPPAPERVSSINIIPRIGDAWGAIRLADGMLEILGGTKEPGEQPLQTLQRELREEMGASLGSYQLVGGWQCQSLTSQPYRPHLPFPDFIRLVWVGQVVIESPPAIPVGGEQVEGVEILPLEAAVQRFSAQGRLDLAELYQLAADVYLTK